MEALEIFITVLFASLFASALFLGYSVLTVREEKRKLMGIPGYMDRPKTDDCAEAARMMVDFIGEGIVEDRKYNECSIAGCDGRNALRNSRDIANLVKVIHGSGCRLVLRRVADHDMEDPGNTTDEVKDKLADLDIARAKRIENKFK